MSFPLYAFFQMIYWLGLSTWFGGVLFVAITAPVVFRTVREGDPVLPTVLSVNLEGQHATLLAGSIVSNLIGLLSRVELGCAAAIAAGLAVQWALHVQDWPIALVRTALFAAAIVLTIYDRLSLWPRISKSRQQYIDHADEPEVANPARERFNRQQRESELLLMLKVALLLGMIVFSASIAPPTTVVLFH